MSIVRSNTGEIRSLTGLRGIASLSVAFVHGGFDHPWIVWVWTFPDAAVDIFFCLSGFSLCVAYRPELGSLRFWRYLRARFARIYPLYALSLVLMWWLVFRHLGGSGYYPAGLYHRDAILNFLMLNSWPLIGSGSNWDFPGWSLSVEAFCYIAIFPILCVLMTRIGVLGLNLKRCLVFVLSAVSVITFQHWWDGNLVSAHLFHPKHEITYWIPIIRAVTMFIVGGIIYHSWYNRDSFYEFTKMACNQIAFVAILLQGFLGFTDLPKIDLVMIAPMLILALASNETALASRVLASPPIHWLGKISFSLYLLHVPVDYQLHYLWPDLKNNFLIDVFVTMGISIIISFLCYKYFEMPLRNAIRGRARVPIHP